MQTQALLVIGLLGALAVQAGDEPWKAKRYQQWEDKDIDQVLNSSPWVNTFESKDSVAWKTAHQRDSMGNIVNSPPGGCVGAGGASRNADCQQDVPYKAPATPVESRRVTVTWTSSRTIREALARRSVLHNGLSEQAAEQFVTKPLAEYHLVLGGGLVLSAPVVGQEQVHEEDIRKTALLKVGGSKREIRASRVNFQKNPFGNVTAIIIMFPKKMPDGGTTIGSDDDIADFECKIGEHTVNVSFDLRKMVDTEGRDL
jgi:hypothetical protein